VFYFRLDRRRKRAFHVKKGVDMEPRYNPLQLSNGAYKAMLALEQYVASCSVEKNLLNLIKLRASQINGCAYCIDMHWKDLRAAGETEQKLYGLDAWEESPYYTPRERAALKWTESVTLISEDRVPDEVYRSVREHFSEQELSDLTVAVAAINVWNRVQIASRAEAGKYRPATAK
jgi:AhpD family alkylhydroperoxidase